LDYISTASKEMNMIARQSGRGFPGGLMTPDFDPFPDHPLSRLLDPLVGISPMWAALNPVNAWAFPALNVWEDQENLYFESELPGFTIDEINLSLVGNELTISGERQEEAPQGAIYHRRERPAGGGGRFSRTLRLAMPIDGDRVAAVLTNGVLSITLPKAESARPRRIPVSAGQQGGAQPRQTGQTQQSSQPQQAGRPQQVAGGHPSQTQTAEAGPRR